MIKQSTTLFDYKNTPYSQLPDPGVACNEWPNPPWNTTCYSWHTEYQVCTPEWFAQHTAKNALKIGLQYGTRDLAEEQRVNLEQYLIAGGDKKPSLVKTEQRQIEQEPNMQTQELRITIGVLTNTHLCCFSNGKPTKIELPSITQIGDILQLCFEHNLRSIWVMSGTTFSDLATRDFIEASRADWEITATYTDGPPQETKYCKFVSGYKSGARTVYVGFCEHNDDWGLGSVDKPMTVVATIAYLEDALGIPITFSSGNVGTKLLEKLSSKERENWIQHTDISKVPVWQEIYNQDLNWKRELTEQEMQIGFVVGYDKTMMYTASDTSVLLGVGEPVYTDSPQFHQKVAIPGIWHVKISGTSMFDGIQLPHPTDGKTEGWFYSYTVKLLYELGYDVEIVEAWIWQEYHAILRPLAEKIRDARTALDDKWEPDLDRYKNAEARAIASLSVKHLSRKTIGWLGLTDAVARAMRGEKVEWYIRPDWRGLTIDNARYQMFWRIRTYIEKGYFPIGAHVDCLYYLSDTNEYTNAVPHMMEKKNQRTKEYEPNQYKLGGYKPHYETDITSQEAALYFNDPKLDMGQVNQKLHTIEKKRLRGEM